MRHALFISRLLGQKLLGVAGAAEFVAPRGGVAGEEFHILQYQFVAAVTPCIPVHVKRGFGGEFHAPQGVLYVGSGEIIAAAGGEGRDEIAIWIVLIPVYG